MTEQPEDTRTCGEIVANIERILATPLSAEDAACREAFRAWQRRRWAEDRAEQEARWAKEDA